MSRENKFFLKDEAGQVSIFLGIILLVVISFIAFVINVGLFVKAKINLQNAVDASAYAGAAVQARQLTNIGHLNWELRNTYKEWMFKYYVLGQVGLDAIDNIDGNEPAPDTSIKLNNQGMNFRLRQFKGTTKQFYNASVFDLYNVPSTCIHYGANNNICEIVSIPGLPRFNTVGLPSISEHHEAFLNSIVATKAQDCSSRSNINQGAAMMWAYGTENSSLFADVPEIAADRPGAWIQSLEIAMRMRNLERIVNEPPAQDFICMDPAVSAGKCSLSVSAFANSGKSLPFHERTAKAFFSGYRNLSGGAYKSRTATSSADFGLKYRMRELAPVPLQVEANSLSGYLIPQGRGDALSKYYLDLQLMPVNLATFYTTFVSTTGSFKNSGTKSEADCGGTKTALPVPGYIVNAVKNPEVLTYYAVEGESDFTGLFYPFYEDPNGITLKAYAAAKPFGGRIGPALFKVQGGSTILPREDAELKLSSNYVSALNVADVPSTGVRAGYPIPTDQSFWSNNSANNTIGGNPSVAGQTFFTIPNLVYDFNNYSEIQNLGISRSNIQVLRKASSDSEAYVTQVQERYYGLYDIEQFRKFAANKVSEAGQVMDSNQVAQSIYNVRKPTRYEALNYLVPVMIFDDGSSGDINTDQYNFVHPLPNPPPGAIGGNTRLYRLFAPLSGGETLYPSTSDIIGTVNSYITASEPAVAKYLGALKEIADQMRAEAVNTVGGDAYLTAANSIHNEPPIVSESNPDSPVCQGLSMAQKFSMFFSTSGTGCGITPLGYHITTYFSDKESNFSGWQNYYTSVYTKPDFDLKSLLSAYRPGPRQGADNLGNAGSPFIEGNLLLSQRNSYSTKLVPLAGLTTGQRELFAGSNLPIFSEGNSSGSYSPSQIFDGSPVRNLLPAGTLSEYGNLWF